MPADLCNLWHSAFQQVIETGQPHALAISFPGPGAETSWDERFIPEFGVDGKVESVLVIGREVTEERRLQKVAEAAHEKIRALAARLMAAQEEERRRLSRELHDDLCQNLASLSIDIGGLIAEQPTPDAARTQLEALQRRVIHVAESARHIAYQLHPSVLDDLGLVAALRALCDEFSEREEIAVAFQHEGPRGLISRETAACCFRVAQEALKNIARHSGSEYASVTLSETEDQIMLCIEDDGAGFDLATVKGKGRLGLVSMEERARLVNGRLSIEAEPGRGSRIVLTAPAQVVMEEAAPV